MTPAIHPAGTAAAVSAAVRSLLRHFHRQRPIRGGSLLITIFGDSIAPRGGAITLGSLIGLARPFGLTERLVRTSVARLARDGWLEARREGRRSEYRLTPLGQDRFAEATRRIYGEIPNSWDGQWTLLVLPPPANGGRRQDVRDELRWLGFGQVSPGVFAHPNWSLEQARAGLKGLDGAGDGLLLKSSSEGNEVDRRLITAGWDLGDLTRRYRRFVATFTPVLDAAALSGAATTPASTAAAPDVGSGAGASTGTELTGASASGGVNAGASAGSELSGEAAFVIRTLLIHEYRKIHLRDPLLPPALLPADWVGAAAYDLSKRLYSVVFPAAESYLSIAASNMTASLPPANGSAYARFGGLGH
jgi:phenylacetic acid degradation operon negative regulatory protein